VLSGIIAQNRRGERVSEYSLGREILYCHSSRRGELKIVVPTVAIPMVFAYFHESPLGCHWVSLRL
jgi:hypothetical protein